MKRRDFVSRLGLGSAALITPTLASPIPRAQDKNSRKDEEHDHGRTSPMHGSDANAVVNFGQWKTSPPLDRFPNAPLPPPTNNHQLLPARVTIKAGGSVSYIIAGLHQIVVYGPGVRPTDINTTPSGLVTTGVPAGVPLVDDPNSRIYRGPDPSLLGTLDRVESVHFPEPGRYLVICGILPHFLEGMFGYVLVKR